MTYFAEARLNNRALYEEAGFIDEGTSAPGYFFAKGSKRIRPGALRRQDFPKRVEELYDDTLSPEENWENLGLPLVFTCGLTKWIRHFQT